MDDIAAAFGEQVRMAVRHRMRWLERIAPDETDDPGFQNDYADWMRELDAYNVACRKWDKVKRN